MKFLISTRRLFHGVSYETQTHVRLNLCRWTTRYLTRCIEGPPMMDLKDCYHARAIQGSHARLIIPLNFSAVVIFFSIQIQRPLLLVCCHRGERVDLNPDKKKIWILKPKLACTSVRGKPESLPTCAGNVRDSNHACTCSNLVHTGSTPTYTKRGVKQGRELKRDGNHAISVSRCTWYFPKTIMYIPYMGMFAWQDQIVDHCWKVVHLQGARMKYTRPHVQTSNLP